MISGIQVELTNFIPLNKFCKLKGVQRHEGKAVGIVTFPRAWITGISKFGVWFWSVNGHSHMLFDDILEMVE